MRGHELSLRAAACALLEYESTAIITMPIRAGHVQLMVQATLTLAAPALIGVLFGRGRVLRVGHVAVDH